MAELGVQGGGRVRKSILQPRGRMTRMGLMEVRQEGIPGRGNSKGRGSGTGTTALYAKNRGKPSSVDCNVHTKGHVEK